MANNINYKKKASESIPEYKSRIAEARGDTTDDTNQTGGDTNKTGGDTDKTGGDTSTSDINESIGDVNTKIGEMNEDYSLDLPELTRLEEGSTAQDEQEEENINAEINSEQDDVIKSEEEGEGPDTRDLESAFEDVSGFLDEETETDVPDVPDLSEQYETFREEAGIEDLEKQINRLNKQQRKVQSQLRKRQAAHMDEPVSTNVIEGRVGEVERQEMQRLDFIKRQKQALNDQLKTKMKMVENTMKFKQADYDNARKMYQQEYKKHLDMLKYAEGDLERERQDAKANLEVFYNMARDGRLNYNQLSDKQKNHIRELELKSGFPTGFYKVIEDNYPDNEILTSSTRIDNNKKYADIVMRTPDGKIDTKTALIDTGVTSDEEDDSEMQVDLAPNDKRTLIGAGFTESEIQSIAKDVSTYGLPTVLDRVSGENAEEQRKALRVVYDAEESEPVQDPIEYVDENFTTEDLKKYAKKKKIDTDASWIPLYEGEYDWSKVKEKIKSGIRQKLNAGISKEEVLQGIQKTKSALSGMESVD